MSAFWAKCPRCGKCYFHLLVGTQLLSGHNCESDPLIEEPLDFKGVKAVSHRGFPDEVDPPGSGPFGF